MNLCASGEAYVLSITPLSWRLRRRGTNHFINFSLYPHSLHAKKRPSSYIFFLPHSFPVPKIQHAFACLFVATFSTPQAVLDRTYCIINMDTD